MNAFRHGLSAIQKRRESGVATEHEETIKAQIMEGLMADNGGEAPMSTVLKSWPRS
jgi:hypothetical protein